VSLLLHAITTPADAPAAATVCLNVGGMTAWYTALPTDTGPFTKEDMLEHHRVVSQIFNRVDACLPARFPTLVADEDELRSQLEAKADVLAAQLGVVRGACEIAVTAVWTVEPADDQLEAVPPGRRYLLRRASSERRRQRADQLADSLEQAAGQDVLQARRRVCPSAQVALSLALLLRRTTADNVRERLGRDLGEDVRILVNGPWAPYTFADARPIASRET